jgi:hypothetical protein
MNEVRQQSEISKLDDRIGGNERYFYNYAFRNRPKFQMHPPSDLLPPNSASPSSTGILPALARNFLRTLCSPLQLRHSLEDAS